MFFLTPDPSPARGRGESSEASLLSADCSYLVFKEY